MEFFITFAVAIKRALMNRSERKSRERYEAEAHNSKVRSVMNSYVPEGCQKIREMFGLSSVQNPQSGEAIPSETANSIICALCEELEKRIIAEEKSASEFKEVKTELKRLKTLLAERTTPPTPTSENSGIPSSKNPISEQERIKKKTKSLRKRSNKPVGGQVGHKGATLKRKEKVDHRVPIFPTSETCPNCGTVIPRSLFTEGETRQVIDLCKDIIETTEKISMTAKCPVCGTVVKGEFGDLEGGNVNYGINLKSAMTVLNNRHAMPYKRTVEFLNDITGLNISVGTLKNTIRTASDLSEDELKTIVQNLLSPNSGFNFMYADETGAGPGRWLWVFGNGKMVVFIMTHSRSSKEILREFPGGFKDKYLVTDRHSAYFTKDIVCMGHQICLVHILRNIQYYIDFFPEYEWPKKLYNTIETLMHEAKALKTDEERKKLYDEYYPKILGLLSEPTCRSDLPSDDAVKYIEDFKKGLIKHKDHFLTFLLVQMPAENNAAERNLRMTKVKMKVSGVYRSEDGGIHYANLQSLVQTCREDEDRNYYKTFIKLFSHTKIVKEII